jgi:hypothetical protein
MDSRDSANVLERNKDPLRSRADSRIRMILLVITGEKGILIPLIRDA